MSVASLLKRLAAIEAQRAAVPTWEWTEPEITEEHWDGIMRVLLFEVGEWCMRDVLRDSMGLSEEQIAAQIALTAQQYEAWREQEGRDADNE